MEQKKLTKIIGSLLAVWLISPLGEIIFPGTSFWWDISHGAFFSMTVVAIVSLHKSRKNTTKSRKVIETKALYPSGKITAVKVPRPPIELTAAKTRCLSRKVMAVKMSYRLKL